MLRFVWLADYVKTSFGNSWHPWNVLQECWTLRYFWQEASKHISVLSILERTVRKTFIWGSSRWVTDQQKGANEQYDKSAWIMQGISKRNWKKVRTTNRESMQECKISFSDYAVIVEIWMFELIVHWHHKGNEYAVSNTQKYSFSYCEMWLYCWLRTRQNTWVFTYCPLPRWAKPSQAETYVFSDIYGKREKEVHIFKVRICS